MFNPPPVFRFQEQPAPQRSRDGWWSEANRLAQAALDATTTSEIDTVTRDNRQVFEAMKLQARDLARSVSMIFADRRRELGGSNAE